MTQAARGPYAPTQHPGAWAGSGWGHLSVPREGLWVETIPQGMFWGCHDVSPLGQGSPCLNVPNTGRFGGWVWWIYSEKS